MKLSQLALTLVLVAGGIFVYDALVVRDAGEQVAETIRDEEPHRPVEAELPSFAVLEGRGDEIWRSDVERRLEQLEQTPTTAGRTEAAGDGSESGVPGVEPVPGDAEEEAVDEDGNPRPRRFTRQDVATFRALLETVERQRREEKIRQQMVDGLKKIGVELTDAQTKEVVDLTLGFYRGVKGRLQTIPQGEETREQRAAVYQQLKSDYADELYGIVPRTEADRIMEAIQRNENRQSKDGK